MKTEKRTKLDRVREGRKGMLVAAIFPGGKIKSAKIVRNYCQQELLAVETKYGRSLRVKYADVVWIQERPECRWPKGVLISMKSGVPAKMLECSHE